MAAAITQASYEDMLSPLLPRWLFQHQAVLGGWGRFAPTAAGTAQGDRAGVSRARTFSTVPQRLCVQLAGDTDRQTEGGETDRRAGRGREDGGARRCGGARDAPAQPQTPARRPPALTSHAPPVAPGDRPAAGDALVSRPGLRSPAPGSGLPPRAPSRAERPAEPARPAGLTLSGGAAGTVLADGGSGPARSGRPRAQGAAGKRRVCSRPRERAEPRRAHGRKWLERPRKPKTGSDVAEVVAGRGRRLGGRGRRRPCVSPSGLRGPHVGSAAAGAPLPHPRLAASAQPPLVSAPGPPTRLPPTPRARRSGPARPRSRYPGPAPPQPLPGPPTPVARGRGSRGSPVVAGARAPTSRDPPSARVTPAPRRGRPRWSRTADPGPTEPDRPRRPSRSGQRSRRHAVAQAAPRAGASESAGKHAVPRAGRAVCSGVRCGSRPAPGSEVSEEPPETRPSAPAPVHPGHANARDPESGTEEARGLPAHGRRGSAPKPCLPATPDAASPPGSAAGLDPGGGRCPRFWEDPPGRAGRRPRAGRGAPRGRQGPQSWTTRSFSSAPGASRAPADTVRPARRRRVPTAERLTRGARILLWRATRRRVLPRSPPGRRRETSDGVKRAEPELPGDPRPVRLREAELAVPEDPPRLRLTRVSAVRPHRTPGGSASLGHVRGQAPVPGARGAFPLLRPGDASGLGFGPLPAGGNTVRRETQAADLLSSGSFARLSRPCRESLCKPQGDSAGVPAGGTRPAGQRGPVGAWAVTTSAGPSEGTREACQRRTPVPLSPGQSNVTESKCLSGLSGRGPRILSTGATAEYRERVARPAPVRVHWVLRSLPDLTGFITDQNQSRSEKAARDPGHGAPRGARPREGGKQARRFRVKRKSRSALPSSAGESGRRQLPGESGPPQTRTVRCHGLPSNPPHPSSLVIPVNIGVASDSPDKSSRNSDSRFRSHGPDTAGTSALLPTALQEDGSVFGDGNTVTGNPLVPTVFAAQLPGHLHLRPPPVGALERDTTCWADVDFSHL
ncbi:collagen alpha-1(I) chain-like [Mustela putorius furo]|uniref:Collagen alpha-1(I) chain-like n=1 Tax=Mustela putorius furo TaxID=9669 RepID=A0A8U0V3I3_MUSPF|nr:collagen alpha-1(I) chain-like [Mustela putorius furo]